MDASRGILVERQPLALPGLIVALLRQLARPRAAGRGFRRRWDACRASSSGRAPQAAQRRDCRRSASGRGRRSPRRSPACRACRHGRRYAAAAGLRRPRHRSRRWRVPTMPASPSGISVKVRARRCPPTTAKRLASSVRVLAARAMRPDRARTCPARPGRRAPPPRRRRRSR